MTVLPARPACRTSRATAAALFSVEGLVFAAGRAISGVDTQPGHIPTTFNLKPNPKVAATYMSGPSPCTKISRSACARSGQALSSHAKSSILYGEGVEE